MKKKAKDRSRIFLDAPFYLRMEPTLKEKLELEAKLRVVSEAAVVRMVLRNFFDTQEDMALVKRQTKGGS